MRAIILLLLLLTTPLCVAESSAHQSPAVRLGVTVPLTGDFASYGKLIQEGIELAKADLESSGQKVDIIYEDACLPAGAVTAIKKLITVDKINGLAANFCAIAMPPMAETIERNKIVAFHTASASDSILNAGKFIFTTNIKVQNEARKLADYARKVLHANTASVLYITTDFGQDYNKHFAETFEQLGGKVLSSDTNPAGANEFKTELTKVKAKNPDVIFAAHLGPTLGILLKQARALGLKQQFLGVYEAEDPSVLETAGDAAEGLQFFVPEPETESSEVKQFRTEFEKRYGHSPRILASNAYDAMMLATRSLAGCGLDPECAKNKVYETRNYPGVSGTFSIDADGGTEKAFVLKSVEHGQFVRE